MSRWAAIAGRAGHSGGARSRSLLVVAATLLAAAAVVIVALLSGPASTPASGPAAALAANPALDPGTTLGGPAPAFTLADQSGHPLSLRSLRGHVVVLAFTDPTCTAACPLSTTVIAKAKAMLGAAGTDVALVGIDANPAATATSWLRSYSQAHGMAHQWRFLTGPPAALARVWHDYHVTPTADSRIGGEVPATPAIYVVNAQGKLAKLYVIQTAYASITQQAQLLASELSTLLPTHPVLRAKVSYRPIAPITPSVSTSLTRAGGGSVHVGPGSPTVLVFFTTWLTQTSDLRARLEGLDSYQAALKAARLPKLIGVDEGSVEPAPSALARFLASLSRPLSYPVAIDRSGRLADGYNVQGQPWFVLTSGDGTILWYWDPAAQGWLSASALARHVRAALSEPAKSAPPTPAQARRLLAGSPPALDAIHRQASQLLGSYAALAARLRALRGYPVVLNAWASWCGPCRSEYPLFAHAAARFGKQVAFLGVDTSDTSAANARSFLAAHPVSYPSYQSSTGQLTSLAGLVGLPTTIFIDRSGRVTCVRPGQYDAQGALDGDITSCALG